MQTSKEFINDILFYRYYHEKNHFHRLMRMLANEVVTRAKSLVSHNILDKLDEVGEKSFDITDY